MLDLPVLRFTLSLTVKALPWCHLLKFEAFNRYLFTMNTIFFTPKHHRNRDVLSRVVTRL